MKKLKFISICIILLVVYNEINAQKFDFFAGVNINSLFLNKEKGESGPYSKTENGLSFEASIGFDKTLLVENIPLPVRMSIHIQNYKTSFFASNGGHYGGTYATADVNKTAVGFIFYPIAIKFKRNIFVDLGIQYSRLILDKSTGYYGSGNINMPVVWGHDIKDYSLKNSFGLAGRFAFGSKMWKNLKITYQYGLYYGLNKEFSLPWKYNLLRQSFSVGFGFI